MATNYRIKNMWQNHRVLFSSIFTILALWVIAGVCLYISGDDNFLSDLFGAGAAIGTIGAVITSLFLYQRAAKDNFENMAKSQRAYLFIDNIEYKYPNNSNVLINLIIKNSGMTIAINVKSSVNYSFSKAIPTDSIDKKGYRQIPCVANNSNVIVPILLSRDLFSICPRVTIWGWLEYNDIFTNNRHRTEFCRIIELKYDSSSTPYFYDTYHEDYNRMDDNC